MAHESVVLARRVGRAEKGYSIRPAGLCRHSQARPGSDLATAPTNAIAFVARTLPAASRIALADLGIPNHGQMDVCHGDLKPGASCARLEGGSRSTPCRSPQNRLTTPHHSSGLVEAGFSPRTAGAVLHHRIQIAADVFQVPTDRVLFWTDLRLSRLLARAFLLGWPQRDGARA